MDRRHELFGRRPAWMRDALCLEHPEVSFFLALSDARAAGDEADASGELAGLTRGTRVTTRFGHVAGEGEVYDGRGGPGFVTRSANC